MEANSQLFNNQLSRVVNRSIEDFRKICLGTVSLVVFLEERKRNRCSIFVAPPYCNDFESEF